MTTVASIEDLEFGTNSVSVRSRWHARRQRVSACARVARSDGGRRHRAGGVADSSADRHERRAHGERDPARDGHEVTTEEAGRLVRLHAEAYARLTEQVRPLPGARDLLAYLTKIGAPWAIATSARIESARPTLERLGVPANVPIITRDQVRAREAGSGFVSGGRGEAGCADS